MANPRKFSEKIAMHNQKQAEETAAFEKIMREVSDATIIKNELNAAQFEVTPSEHHTSREVRGRSLGVGPMRRPSDRKVDTSPYTGNMYLSLPNETSWRRTSSDSAIHQNYLRNQDEYKNVLETSSSTYSLHGSGAGTRRRRTNSCKTNDTVNIPQDHLLNRPKSSCELSSHFRDISTENPGIIPMIGNNTGSLPDLTSCHFPSIANHHTDAPNNQFIGVSEYRPSAERPSPVSSPGQFYAMKHGDQSAPQSPVSQMNFNMGDSDLKYYRNLDQPETKQPLGPSIQQHFEQFSLYDNYNCERENLNRREDVLYGHTQLHDQVIAPSDETLLPSNYSSSESDDEKKHKKLSKSGGQNKQKVEHSHLFQLEPLINPLQATHSHMMPVSSACCIPEIVFTDFSSTTDLNTGDMCGDPIRPIDIELGSMDFASYQMLSEANTVIIADQTLEDSFRLDLK